MIKLNGKEINKSLIGEKIIQNAINLDQALVEILKLEVKRMKKLAKTDDGLKELQKTNFLIKNIIIALTISDDKLQTGIDLYMAHSQLDEETKHD